MVLALEGKQALPFSQLVVQCGVSKTTVQFNQIK